METVLRADGNRRAPTARSTPARAVPIVRFSTNPGELMLSTHQTRGRFAIVLGATLLVTTVGIACASQPRPRPTQLDPSSPAASESPPVILSALGPAPGKPVPAVATSGEKSAQQGNQDSSNDGKSESKSAEPAAVVYTCPMHPEVISDKPGRCPKCGMKLVPKKPTQGNK
jgi:hypothetical protein